MAKKIILNRVAVSVTVLATVASLGASLRKNVGAEVTAPAPDVLVPDYHQELPVEIQVKAAVTKAYSATDKLQKAINGEASYSEDDVVLLAYAMSKECYDVVDAQRVGSVILNRVKSKSFPDSILEVIEQDDPVQYPWANGYYPREEIGRYDISEEEFIEMARNLLKNGPVLPEDVLFQAQFTQGRIYIHPDMEDGAHGPHIYCYGPEDTDESEAESYEYVSEADDEYEDDDYCDEEEEY